MGAEFDPGWEYWTPADPEVGEILAEAARCGGFAGLGLEERRSERSGALVGVRFGRGNPDFARLRLGRAKKDRGRGRSIPPRTCPGCGRVWQPDRSDRRYCSLGCRECPGAGRTLPEEFRCAGCGRPYRPDRSRRRYCSRACVPPPPRPALRIDRRELRLMYERGDRMADIAARFGSGPPALRKILRQMGVAMRPAGFQGVTT